MSNANQPTAPTNNNGSGDGINTNMISMNYGYTQQQQQSSPHMNYQQKPPQISANSIYHPQQMYNNVPPVYTPNSTQIPHYNHHQQQQQQQLLPPLPTQPTPTDGNFLPPPVPLNNSYESELNNIKSNDDIMEFKLNDNKIKEYKTGELKEDYLKLCDLNIRNFQILHKIYMHLPNNLEFDKRNKDYSIVALFYMAYMTVAKDLCMKYDSIEDLVLFLCLMLARKEKNSELKTYIEKVNYQNNIMKNVNTFSNKTNGVFTLPRVSRKRKVVVKSHANNNNNNNKNEIEKHLVFQKLPWIDLSILDIGKFFKIIIPLDFLPLHSVVKPSLVRKYKVGGSASDQNIQKEPGIRLDADIKTFLVTSVKSVGTFKYTEIDAHVSKRFVSFIEDILPEKRLDRFRLNSAKNTTFLNLETLKEETDKTSKEIQFSIIESMSFYHINSSKSDSNAITNQCFAAKSYKFDEEIYSNMKFFQEVLNYTRCEDLHKKYNIPFAAEDDDDDDDDDDDAPPVKNKRNTDDSTEEEEDDDNDDDDDDEDAVCKKNCSSSSSKSRGERTLMISEETQNN